MSKTPEELNELKNECEALTNKLKELSEDEIELVTGGGIKDWFDKIGEMTKKVVPVGSNPILGGETDIDTRKDLYENIILGGNTDNNQCIV